MRDRVCVCGGGCMRDRVCVGRLYEGHGVCGGGEVV